MLFGLIQSHWIYYGSIWEGWYGTDELGVRLRSRDVHGTVRLPVRNMGYGALIHSGIILLPTGTYDTRWSGEAGE